MGRIQPTCLQGQKLATSMNALPFKSTHDLAFGMVPWITADFTRFKIGTCGGLWRATPATYDILAIINTEPRNGHLIDVLEWFEQSCKRDKKDFQILEIWNEGFKKHLIEKRGFLEIGGEDSVIKQYTR